MTKIKEAGINAGFQNSAIRLADPARAAIKPVFPNIRLNLALACLFATLVAVGAAVISDVLDNTIRDAEQVARIVNTEVVGSLPLVKSWRNRLPAPIKSGSKDLAPVQRVVPRTGGNDRTFATFEEAVRTLRNSILLGQFGQSLKTILVTSASPGEGKTTAAVHLAIAHAEQKHRTLLIDCDLRRPGVQRALAFSPDEPGLSNALNNGMVWRDKLIKIEGVDDLDVLSAGPVGRRTCDLLGPRLPGLLAEAESEYELVILDAPPLLGFPEPLQLAAAVDGVLVISLAGKTSRKAVTTVVNTLKRLQANVLGLVLNEVTRDLSDDYHYYGYYGKYGRYYGNYAHRDGGKTS